MRVFRLWSLNDVNYASPGTEATGALPPPLAFFVPHAAGPAPEVFCGLIGDPVAQSLGDVWHRHASLAFDGGRIGYAKIFVPGDDLETALYFLLKLNVHGVSVTSPHKREVIHSNFVTSPSGLESGNTLRLVDGGWILTDTDRDGMRASLAALQRRGVPPGRIAVFGRGGVLPAIEDAAAQAGWGPVDAVSSRDGWGALRSQQYALIVNAAGPGSAPHDDPPRADAWLDLHYREIDRIPSAAPVYMNGWTFFVAQALEQRAHWGYASDLQL
jgi:shikimate 5-dehydrogenase